MVKLTIEQATQIANILGIRIETVIRTISKLKSANVIHIEKNKILYRMPILRGHGTHFTDLKGVTAQDWYDDAENALFDLMGFID
jgi:hypothetical protein